ncbi:hypothetical protein OF83DRAFT_1174338, partial [Amylostereum chailletii]
AGAAVAGGVASGAANAITGDILNRESVEARFPPAVKARFPPAVKASGAAVAGGLASGAASAATSNVLGRQVSGDLTVGDLLNVMAMLKSNNLD